MVDLACFVILVPVSNTLVLPCYARSCGKGEVDDEGRSRDE